MTISSLRVAFAHYAEAGDISGVTTWLVGFACRLRAEGIPVGVHLQHRPGQDPDLTPIAEQLRAGGIDLSNVPARSSLAADLREAFTFLNSWKPTVFLPQCRPSHFLAAAAAGDQGLPWVLTLHSDDPHYWALARSFPPSSHGGHPVCVSRHIARHFADLRGEGPMSVIPCGVPIPCQRASFRATPFRVVYSGRLWEHQKRAGLVVESLIRACRTSSSMEAVLIGDGHALPECRSRVASAGLSHAIRFTGRLDSQDVLRELAASQAILLMSDFEGLPVALLEAMALGVVPVVRAIPSGIPELVEQERTGLLVSEDPDQAAEALIRLSADPALWERCSQAARQKVDRDYNADLSYQAWRDLLLELHARATVRYPLQPPRSIALPRPDPLLLAPYRRRPRLRALIRQQWQTRLAQFKHEVRRFTRQG